MIAGAALVAVGIVIWVVCFLPTLRYRRRVAAWWVSLGGSLTVSVGIDFVIRASR